MKSFIFLLILAIITCNNIEKQTEEDLILNDAIGDFLGQIINVINNCGWDLGWVGGQVGDVWNNLPDSQKEEMKNEGLDAILVACGIALSSFPIAGAACEVICFTLRYFF